jgi:hypothetical protein
MNLTTATRHIAASASNDVAASMDTNHADTSDAASSTGPRSTGRRGHRVRSYLVASVAAMAAIVGLASNAHADTMYLNGSESTAYVGGDNLTHKLTILPTALQMSNYPNGQYVVYRVIARDVTYSASTPWSYYAWSRGYTVDGRSTYTSCDVSSCEQMENNTAVSLPIVVLQGVAGHRYQVGVQFAYLIGSSYSYATSIPTTYNNIVWSQGVSFTLPSADART